MVGLLRRRKTSQQVYKAAIIFNTVARQVRMQSRNMEKQAEKKFQRLKELMKKGWTQRARQEAIKVATFRRRAIELDAYAEELMDISATLMGLAPLADTRDVLEKGVRVAAKLAQKVNLPDVWALFQELRTCLQGLGVTLDQVGEPGGIADAVSSEEIPEDEISEIMEKAASEIEAEIPSPEVSALEERLRKLKESKGGG